MKVIYNNQQSSSDPVSSLLGGLGLGSIDPTMGILGGLNGQPGFMEGLFDTGDNIPPTGLNAIWEMFGISGILPRGMKSTLRDAAPIGGQIAGNMFLPYFGGMAGKAAGTLGAMMAFGKKGTDKPNYWTPDQNLNQWLWNRQDI